LRHASRIVAIEGGRIVEDGTHEALLRAGGRYASSGISPACALRMLRRQEFWREARPIS
jgi:hypothetical protein